MQHSRHPRAVAHAPAAAAHTLLQLRRTRRSAAHAPACLPPAPPPPRAPLTARPCARRQCLSGGLRIGLYAPVKSFYVGKDHVGDVPFHTKVAAGLTTGALAITIASPTDLVKVRMQSEGRLGPDVPKKYPSAMAAYRIIAKCAPPHPHTLRLPPRHRSRRVRGLAHGGAAHCHGR